MFTISVIAELNFPIIVDACTTFYIHGRIVAEFLLQVRYFLGPMRRNFQSTSVRVSDTAITIPNWAWFVHWPRPWARLAVERLAVNCRVTCPTNRRLAVAALSTARLPLARAMQRWLRYRCRTHFIARFLVLPPTQSVNLFELCRRSRCVQCLRLAPRPISKNFGSIILNGISIRRHRLKPRQLFTENHWHCDLFAER